MKKIKYFFHFLGGINFAIFLIGSTALLAIIGTFIESFTNSHRYAALFTYGSPLFAFLLWGYFANILVSALRRYPFKTSHIPFLMTHLGLLMILAGTLTKIYFGVQGTMIIWEGSSSDEIILPNSYALAVASKKSKEPFFYTFHDNFLRYSRLKPSEDPPPFFESLDITLLDYAPHSQEKIESWIKANHLSIFGIKPFPLQKIEATVHLQPVKVQLPTSKEEWNLFAFNTEDIQPIATKVYKNTLQSFQNTLLIFQNKENDICMFAMTKEGQVGCYLQQNGALERILAYDQGFSGYSVEAHFPELPFLTLESPLIPSYLKLPALKKLEDNIPCIALRFKKNDLEQIATLGFCPHGLGFKWPILNGQYMVRFQPLFRKIPYCLRLRQARQINYPGTEQPYSFECDLIITQKNNHESVETSISMNNVYETWDGYRFYLSNLSPSNKGELKRVQIVVNKDPAKYWLTYLGAMILSIGIILLFFKRKKP